MQRLLRPQSTSRDEVLAQALTDDALVTRAREDPQAFALLYRRYLDAVHQYCYRRLGSREAAEDAASRTFTSAFASLPRYRDGSFRSWLFAIAYHVITDDLRARRVVDELDAAAEIPDHDPGPEAFALAVEAEMSVRQLLNHLPEGQRRVVELRLAGLTGREVATVLGCSHGAVKIAQMRAYQRLRGLLARPPSEG